MEFLEGKPFVERAGPTTIFAASNLTVRHSLASQEDLLAGCWADAIDALMAQPAPPGRPAVNGADIAADRS